MRKDEPWRRTSDLKRSWRVDSGPATAAEDPSESASHVADTELARDLQYTVNMPLSTWLAAGRQTSLMFDTELARLMRRSWRARRPAAVLGESDVSRDVPTVLGVPRSAEQDSREETEAAVSRRLQSDRTELN